MKFRVYSGAVLSLLDLATDIETIFRFWKEGNFSFAKANIAFIAASLLLQLLIVVGTNIKQGKKKIAYECLIVVCMIKPAGKYSVLFSMCCFLFRDLALLPLNYYIYQAQGLRLQHF